MARTLDKEPIFQTVKVVPSHSPPVGAVRTDPFISQGSNCDIQSDCQFQQVPVQSPARDARSVEGY